MAIKIYGASISTNNQYVMAVVNALGLEVEFVPVELAKGAHKAPEFLKKHPFGKIPVLEDDGFVLYESRAICRYLCLKYQKPSSLQLYPTDVEGRAIVEQYISVEFSYYNTHIQPMVGEAVFKKKFRGGEPDQAVILKHKQGLEEMLGVYETFLDGRSYIAGDHLTLADIFHLPFGNYAVQAGLGDVFDNPARPNVKKWWTNISSHEVWVKTLAAN